MKRLFCMIISLALLISLCACNVTKEPNEDPTPPDTTTSAPDPTPPDTTTSAPDPIPPEPDPPDSVLDPQIEMLKEKIDSLENEQSELKEKLEAAEDDETVKERQKEYLDTLVRSLSDEISTRKLLIAEYECEIEAKTEEITDLAEDDTDIEENSELEDLKTSLEDTKITLESEQAALEEKEAELEKQIEETLAYIEQLQSDQAAYEAEYEKAKAAEEQANADIEALLAQRVKEQAESGDGPEFGGTLMWPTPGYSRISSYFGPRTLWGRYDYHLGIDIPAPSGTNIIAAADGVVVTAAYHYSYGYYILIDHGSGYATLYAHNSRLLVNVGDAVSQGQHIAEMGTTGSSSGNHLHFEVRINGGVQDPNNYVAP